MDTEPGSVWIVQDEDAANTRIIGVHASAADADAHLERLGSARAGGTVSYARYPIGWTEEHGAAGYRPVDPAT